MNSKLNYYTIFVVIAVFSLIIVGTTIYSQNHSEQPQPYKSLQQGENEAPLLDYESEIRASVSKERKEKNQRFNSRGNPVRNKQITEIPPGVEPLPTITHWWRGLPALPVAQSTAIVIGNIIGSEAHLSDDKTGIYSEFLVGVDDVFKDVTGSIKSNNTLSVNRVGGNVRFNSGRINKYKIHQQGMPQKGRRYLLFLQQTGSGDFLILTGYELTNNKVVPLDGEDNKDPRSALPFARYRGAGELQLLQDLRSILQNNLGGGQ